VRSEVLIPLLEQSASALIELPWQANAENHARICPECTTMMETVKLGTVALDRHEPHGVWFDAKELAALLGQAKTFRVGSHEEVHVGVLERLAGLFR
jgi:Transcription factor zinc-finger